MEIPGQISVEIDMLHEKPPRWALNRRQRRKSDMRAVGAALTATTQGDDRRGAVYFPEY
jgi:hypothetical protein